MGFMGRKVDPRPVPSEIASRRHRLHLPGAASARPQGAAQEAQAAAGPRLQRAVGEGPVHGDLAGSNRVSIVVCSG